MKALVLTCDHYHALTEHMIRAYERLWPNHPFTYYVPYQEQQALRNTGITSPTQMIQTPADIRSTVLQLLSGIEDDEWIYWCIDDKYPIRLNIKALENIIKYLPISRPDEVSGIAFIRCRRWLKKQYILPESIRLTRRSIVQPYGLECMRRRDYSHIWIHQFLRASVIRDLFLSLPETIPQAKTLDSLKNQLTLPEQQKLFVTRFSNAVFGESTTEGKLTENLIRSIKKQGYPIPKNFPTSTKSIVIK